jgi:hypothetical protein
MTNDEPEHLAAGVRTRRTQRDERAANLMGLAAR